MCTTSCITGGFQYPCMLCMEHVGITCTCTSMWALERPCPCPTLSSTYYKYAQLLLLLLSSTVTAASIHSVVCCYWQQWVLVVEEYGEERYPGLGHISSGNHIATPMACCGGPRVGAVKLLGFARNHRWPLLPVS